MVARKLSPIAGFSPILRVPYLLMVTLVIQVLSPILRVSPILLSPIKDLFFLLYSLNIQDRHQNLKFRALFVTYRQLLGLYIKPTALRRAELSSVARRAEPYRAGVPVRK